MLDISIVGRFSTWLLPPLQARILSVLRSLFYSTGEFLICENNNNILQKQLFLEIFSGIKLYFWLRQGKMISCLKLNKNRSISLISLYWNAVYTEL